MSYFPSSILDAAPVGASPALRVSTNYMETFLPLQSVSSGTEIRTFLNGQGTLDIYSVGSDGDVCRLRPGHDIGAPYVRDDLRIQASQLYPFVPPGGDPNMPAILGLDGTGKLTLSTWREGRYVQRPTGPSQDVIRRFLAVRGTSGRVYVNVRLSDGRLATNYFDPVGDKWGGPFWAPVKGPDGKDAEVKDFTMVGNDPVQSALLAIGSDDEVLFAEESFRTSQLRKLGRKASNIAVVSDAKNRLNVLAVDRSDGLLWVKRQREHSTNGIQFDDWVRVDPSQPRRLLRVTPNLRRDGLLEVFALDEQGNLNYTRQTLDQFGRLAGWLQLFPIAADRRNAIFTVGRDSKGFSEAFTVTPENVLLRFWQSPETGQWASEPLQIPAVEDRLIAMPTHATEIVVVDDDGTPLQNAQVTVNAAYLSTLWIDGKAYRSSLVDPVTLNTGMLGKLVILQRAHALAGATLLISTPRTPAGQPLQVEPNAQLQAKLGRLSKEDILNARDRQGQLLLAQDTKNRDQVAESLAKVTQRSMEIAGVDERAKPVQYRFIPARVGRGSAGPRFAALGEVAWEIDFSSGVPIYRNTTPDDAAVERANVLAISGGSPFDIDWGSVWRGIKNGVGWLLNELKKIVVTVVDGIAKVIFYIGEKVFEAILEFAQQAFDFIEGVWNWLKVKLQQLYEWLGFLFDFEDFARTARGIKHTTAVMLDFSADAIHSVRDQVSNGFDQMKERLRGAVDTLLSFLNDEGEPSLGSYFRQQEPSADLLHASDHNIFLNAYQQNQSQVQVTGRRLAATAPLTDDPLQVLIDKLKALADNFEFGDGKQAFNEAFGYFDSIGSNPNRALQLMLSGLVKALEGVAFFALDFAKGVVLTIFDVLEDMLRVVRELLFKSWEIPVFSQLYQLFTGKRLTVTPIDVVTWLAAVPMTLTIKLVAGRAPWTEKELEDYERTFTADMLRRRLGLAGTPGEQALAVGDWDPAWRTNFLSAYAGVMGLRALVDPGVVISNAKGEGLGEAGIVPIVLRFMSTAFTAPWALSPQAGAPGCEPGTSGLSVTTWICQLIFGPLRGLVIFKVMKPGEARTVLGEVTTSLWGSAQLIMSAVNFAAMEKTTKSKLAFSRSILNFVPGQTLRFMSLSALNKETYFIPAGILAALTFVSFIGSLGVAIAEEQLE